MHGFSGWLGRSWKKLAFFVFLAILPLLVRSPVLAHMLVISCLFGFMGMGWNLIAGYTGLFSLGHCVFFGVGAYTSTILYTQFGLSPWIGMLLGACMAGLVALILGPVCLRLKGPFFALATAAVAQVFQIFAIYFKEVTAGSNGIMIPFRPGLWNLIFREKYTYLWFLIGLSVVGYYVIKHLIKGRLGYYFIAIREDEEAAKMLGINTMRYKTISLTISSIFGAIGGTFYAQYILYISPQDLFSFDISIQLAFVTMLGGAGTLIGPILGSFFITPLSEFLRATFAKYQSLYLFFYGIIMILVVILMPGGLHSWFKMVASRIKTKLRQRPSRT